jgi:hypothetical protein
VCRKTPLEIHFMYLGNKEIYCIFNTCCIISLLFSTKCSLFHNFIFFCSNNSFCYSSLCYLLLLYSPLSFFTSFLPIDRTALFKATSSHCFTHALTLSPPYHFPYFADTSTLKMEPAGTLKMLVPMYQLIWHQIPEDQCEKLR